MMRLVLHPRVPVDVDGIMAHYERVATPVLGGEFLAELRRCFVEAALKPGAFAVRKGDLRRVNLERFPYHFLFRVVGADTVRVLVVRHHRRHPGFGTRRR